jgi:hypothetical protein
MWIPIEGGFLHAARFDRIQFDGDAYRAIRYGREAAICEFTATPAEVARTLDAWPEDVLDELTWEPASKPSAAEEDDDPDLDTDIPF